MYNTVEESVELQEKLYPIRENWNLLQPYLNDKDVQNVLNEAMTEFCEQHLNRSRKMWEPWDAPWEYTTSDYWVTRIGEKVEMDKQYQKDTELLSIEWIHKLFGKDADEYKADLWDDLWENDEYQEQWGALHDKYCRKHSPQEGTIEWYQFIHGCHWINQFTAALISKALDVEVFIWQTEKHTCAVFGTGNVVYFADILIEWENPQKLLDFIGDEERDYYPIFELSPEPLVH